MKTCGNCRETQLNDGPFCNADGRGTTDVSGDTHKYAEACLYYRPELSQEEWEKIKDENKNRVR